MANRDETWGARGRHGDHDRWRPDNEHHRVEHDRPWERRAFGRAGEYSSDEDRYGPGSRGRRWEGEPWRREGRWGARRDEERSGYGAAPGGGQAYGLEGGRGHRSEGYASDRGQRETWRPEGGAPYGDLELNARNRGVQDYGAPHDYAYHPQPGHELDPEYLNWRDEQMRAHDRDYQEWRRHRQLQYDEDYRRFREHRRDRFGRSFQEWRSQRSAGGGAQDAGAAPGVGGYRKTDEIP